MMTQADQDHEDGWITSRERDDENLINRYEDALRRIVESEEQTMSYPDDMYFRAVAIARKALDP